MRRSFRKSFQLGRQWQAVTLGKLTVSQAGQAVRHKSYKPRGPRVGQTY